MARFGLPTVLGASAAGAYGMSQFQESGMAGVWSMLPGSNWKPTPGSSGEVRLALLNVAYSVTIGGGAF